MTSGSATLRSIVDLLDSWYPPGLASDWDAPGLVCGDPAARVRSVLFAVDPVAAVVDEAIASSADLIVAHHPLFLRGVHGVPASDPKGALVHRLISSGCALLTKHTDADHARPGVSDSLASALGVVDTVPLEPLPGQPRLGTGRVGSLAAPLSLRAFAARVADALPTTSHGVRVAGDPERLIRRVAVCGGSGDSLLEVVATTEADAYVTSDLRHHRASDAVVEGGPALVDVAHWAGEWLWCRDAAERLQDHADGVALDLRVAVSATVTDPWTFRI